jgi:hypothetical protein
VIVNVLLFAVLDSAILIPVLARELSSRLNSPDNALADFGHFSSAINLMLCVFALASSIPSSPVAVFTMHLLLLFTKRRSSTS